MLHEIEANPMLIEVSMNEILANLHELSTCLSDQLKEISTLIAQARRTQVTSKVFTTDDTPAHVGEVASFQQTRDYAHYVLNKCAVARNGNWRGTQS